MNKSKEIVEEEDEQVEGVSREAKSWHDLPYYSVYVCADEEIEEKNSYWLNNLKMK